MNPKPLSAERLTKIIDFIEGESISACQNSCAGSCDCSATCDAVVSDIRALVAAEAYWRTLFNTTEFVEFACDACHMRSRMQIHRLGCRYLIAQASTPPAESPPPALP